VNLGDCALNRCTINIATGQLISPKDKEIARDKVLAQREEALLHAQAHSRFLQEQEAERDRRRSQELEAELEHSRSQAELVEQPRPPSVEATPAPVAQPRPYQDSSDSSSHEEQPVQPGVGDKPRVTLLARLKRFGRRLIEPI